MEPFIAAAISMSGKVSHIRQIIRATYFFTKDAAYPYLKRSLDIAGSITGLILLSPVLILITIAVKLTSKGPAIYKQVRVGLYGKLFYLYKFRSMIENAEELLPSLQEQNEAEGPHFKMENDPRVTPIGEFIRKYAFDELPQLYNILIGDMSFVGPRPALPREVDEYETWQLDRLNGVPGLTGVWQGHQIDGKDMSFSEWARSDIAYLNTRSIYKDIKMIIKTFRVFVKGH